MVEDDSSIKAVTKSEVTNSNRHFIAADVGTNYVIIFSYKGNKYFRSGKTVSSVLMASEAVDCGDECHFVLENINLPARRKKRGIFFQMI